jgi:RNA-binding protein 39
VFVTQLHPRVEERDLFEFFSHVGRVEDIRMIRDQRTHKSKGLAYVEFWEKDCVNKAIALTGQELGGYPITVQITPTASQVPSRAEEIKPMRLYVGSLHFNVTESDLRPVFEAFGVVESIELHKDPSTGKSRGFGFVTYKNEGDARQALANLNGLEIAGRPMKVGIVSEGKDDGGDTMGVGDLDEDGGGGMVLSAENRVRLMQKLQRGNEMGPMSSTPQMPSSHQGGGRDSGVISAARDLSVPLIQPSTCVVVKNMFDPKEEKDPDFHLDIKEDVEEECTKYGKLKHIFVDKHSQGHVYLRFANIDGAAKCVENLHNRWFASKRITAEYVVEATYLLKFPDAK